MDTASNDEVVPLSVGPDGSIYGSTVTEETDTTPYEDDDEDEDDDFDDGPSSVRSFHLGMKKVNVENVWTSARNTSSFMQHGRNYQLVPTQLKDNVKLILDTNLEPTEKGTFYYAEDSFYNNSREPQYALTIAPDIYQRIFAEVSDSQAIPCGLYFCCHGGDAAHTGVSHEDYVDIRVAWVLVSIVFVALVVLSLEVPWPSNGEDGFS